MPHRVDGVELGPYVLHAPAGAGGFAVVWRGVHRASSTPIAAKVLRTAALGGADAELAAIARLDHPHIVALHGFGELGARQAEALGEDPGSTYLVMQWAPGGTLATSPGPLVPPVRAVLAELLEGLAHAHARGVIHRDVKPQNVLLTANGSPLLADFGIAALLDSLDAHTRIVGSPQYMAPEQFSRDTGAIGPWTDLYGLGCLAWALWCGAPPYSGGTFAALAAQHTAAPIPALPAHVPHEHRAWLVRMLAKRPADRFQHAADARAALAGLVDPTRVAMPADSSTTWATEEVELPAAPRPPSPGPGATAPPPDLPESWTGGAVLDRAWSRVANRLHLAGAGQEMVHLRRPPVAGRVAQRDRLWAVLGAVVRRGTPGAVVIDGAPGVGRRTLARWVAERAAEVGAALPWRAGGSGRPAVEVVHEPTDHALEALRARVELGAGGPVLIAVTLDSSASRARRSDVLASLRRCAAVSWLALEPLLEAEHDALLRAVLAVDPSTRAGIVHATSGNPGFALDAVRHWVERGALERGPSGYRLAPGAVLALPTASPDGLARRLSALLADAPEARGPLEVLAAFGGPAVAVAAWERACQGLDATHAAERARAAGVLGGSPQTVRLTHPVYGVLLERGAREAGRWTERAGRAAAESSAIRPDRRAVVFDHAGRDDAVIQAALDLARDALALEGPVVLGLELAARALDRSGAAPDDVRRSEVAFERATAACDPQLRGRLVERLEEIAVASERPADRARWLLASAIERRDSGDPAGAAGPFGRAIAAAERDGSPELVADALHRWLFHAWVAPGGRDLAADFDRAAALYRDLGDPVSECGVWTLRSGWLIDVADVAGALSACDRALACLASTPADDTVVDAGMALCNRAEALLCAGRVELALRDLERSEAALRQDGGFAVLSTRLPLAVARTWAGADVRAALRALADQLDQVFNGPSRLGTGALAARADAEVAQGDPLCAEELVLRVDALLDAHVTHHTALTAACLERAARGLAPGSRRRALVAALRQYRTLGRSAEVARVEAALRALP